MKLIKPKVAKAKPSKNCRFLMDEDRKKAIEECKLAPETKVLYCKDKGNPNPIACDECPPQEPQEWDFVSLWSLIIRIGQGQIDAPQGRKEALDLYCRFLQQERAKVVEWAEKQKRTYSELVADKKLDNRGIDTEWGKQMILQDLLDFLTNKKLIPKH